MDAFTKYHLQSTTQNYLEIYDITNDLMILNDGSVAMVMVVGTMNFGLLSEEEQDAIIYSYAGLLNSLTFPIQILIRSQRKDVSSYIQYIHDQEQQTISPLRKTQIKEYKSFVASLVRERNVLDKKFYVVVPYKGAVTGADNPLPQIKKKERIILDKPYILEKAKNDLEPKRDHLTYQFARIGLSCRQLSTQELIHLLHSIYNPSTSDGQRMTDTQSYTTPLVSSEEYIIQMPMEQTQPQAKQLVEQIAEQPIQQT